MWYGVDRTNADADFLSSARELLNSTMRNVVATTGALYLLWHLVATLTWPGEMGWRIWPVTLLVAATCALAYRLIPRSLVAAQAVWQVGLLTAITLAVHLFREPGITFLYMLLPLMAVVTLGWPAGAVVELLLIALMMILVRSPRVPPLTPIHTVGVVAGGAFSGLLGWAAGHTLLTVTQWSLFSYRQAQAETEEARSQKLELQEVQEDLLQANRELARLSERLKMMYQVAEEARQAKEMFVANVSHELRTPLNMIIGFSEMITESPQIYSAGLPPALLADIAAIQRNSQHLAKLVDDVLDLSQVDAGRTTLTKAWTSLPELVDEALFTVRALFETKALYLEAVYDPELPPVFCDSPRIRQVIINLLSNAGRFTEQGGVQVRAWAEQERAVVSVQDTGPGITLEDQARLFEPFQQLDDSIRRRHGGSGLGLSISKRFVEMHRGTMWLESEVGVGSTFFFSLPLNAQVSGTLTTGDVSRWFSPYQRYVERTRPSRAPAPALVPRFVLVEEGDALLQLFERYAPEVEVSVFRDLAAAFEELRRSPARALVVNAPSPVEIPLSKAPFDELPYGVPILSCWVPGEDEVARHLGVERYLVKPVTRQTLLGALGALEGEVRTVLLVDEATSAQQALQLLQSRRPDVLLLDLLLGEMSGFDLLERKRQDPLCAGVPVVVVSSQDPVVGPLGTGALTVVQGGGLGPPELLSCIQVVSEVLSPSPPVDDREPPERPGG